jgi:NADPH:quinone reductase-like Zn-dependent oxidoreductase
VISTRSWLYDRYGDASLLRLRSIDLREPRGTEVLVRVRAAALNPKDSLVRKGRFRAFTGSSFPKKVGVDFAGEIVRGPGFAPGERVYGALEEVTYHRGTVATHVVVRAREVARMPASLSFEEAAALPLVSMTALQALRGRVRHGDHVLLHGASGGVGTVAIQIARVLGAHVTTTSSPGNFALCHELGAHATLDYATGEHLKRKYRAVFDIFGNLSFAKVRQAIERDYVTTVPSARIALDTARTIVGAKHARLVLVRSRREDLDTITSYVDQHLLRPVIDRVVPFEDAIEAMRHLETKHARGKIVIRV